MQIRTGLGLRRKARAARTQVAAARMCIERTVIARSGTDRDREVGRILCYHSIGQPGWGTNDITPERFRAQLEAALEAGYRFVPASTIATTGGSPDELAITFDDSPRSVLTTAAPILASYDIPFSLYVVANWSDQGIGPAEVLTWDEVAQVANLGGEIGNHSMNHPDFGKLSQDQATAEIGEAAELIESRLGIRTTTFAIPLGQSGNWSAHASEAVRQLGYDIIYAQAEETRPPGTVARTFVTKFDGPRIFQALLKGRYDAWEEWV